MTHDFAAAARAAKDAIAKGLVRPDEPFAKVARLYRNTDPPTSREAAERVTAIGSRAAHLQRIVQTVREHPGQTSAELAELSGLERHEAARRTADAATHGLIVRGPSRACRIGGRAAVTWFPRRARAPIEGCPQPETPWRLAA